MSNAAYRLPAYSGERWRHVVLAGCCRRVATELPGDAEDRETGHTDLIASGQLAAVDTARREVQDSHRDSVYLASRSPVPDCKGGEPQ